MQPLSSEQLITLVENLLQNRKRKELLALIDELQPYDLAMIYPQLSSSHMKRFVSLLTLDQQTYLMQELTYDHQTDLLRLLGKTRATDVLNSMDNDDLAHFLEELDDDEAQRLLDSMTTDESQFVLDIMKYPPETAGRLMSNRFIWIKELHTVQEAIEKVRELADLAETINYLYVVNDSSQLVGVVSYRDLLLSTDKERIQHIMYHRTISVHVQTDQEEVANLISQYDFLAIPVVDDNEVLVGIVTVDDVIDIMMQEAQEDIEKLSATGKDIDFTTKFHIATFKRLPWLILLLFIGIISGNIIHLFEGTLSKVVALSFFMPMIAGMTGNTGTQSLAVVVRGLSKQDITKRIITSLILRELWVGLLIGLICGSVLFGVAWLWMNSIMFGVVVGGSLVVTLVIGTLTGTTIPLLLYKLKIDPAIASGPLITTINDILSLLIYFGLATTFISALM